MFLVSSINYSPLFFYNYKILSNLLFVHTILLSKSYTKNVEIGTQRISDISKLIKSWNTANIMFLFHFLVKPILLLFPFLFFLNPKTFMLLDPSSFFSLKSTFQSNGFHRLKFCHAFPAFNAS